MYGALNPSFLMDILKRKKEKLNKILPPLKLLQKSDKSKSDFRMYKGINAFITLLYNLLKYKEEINVYDAPKKAYNILGN